MADQKTSPQAGEVTTFRACRRYMQYDSLVNAGATGNCRLHDTVDCVETYYAASHIAGWTLAGWLRWRRARKAGRR